MGASNDGRTYLVEPRHGAKGTGKIKTQREIEQEIREKFRAAAESDGWENGHSYSGTIAMTGGRIDRFIDAAYEDGTLRKDAALLTLLNRHAADYGEPPWYKPSDKLSGREKAERHADEVAQKWEGAIAVSFMYSPGKGQRKRKGWTVQALCSS
jgi:hypothetical protein